MEDQVGLEGSSVDWVGDYSGIGSSVGQGSGRTAAQVEDGQ